MLLVENVGQRPITVAYRPVPASQATRVPRSFRSARAVGEPSRRSRGSASSLPWKRPVPTSLRTEIDPAPTSRSSPATSVGTSAAGRAPAKGRSSAHPRGVAQRAQPSPSDVSADDTDEERDDDRAARDLDGEAPRGGKLARDRADADEDEGG